MKTCVGCKKSINEKRQKYVMIITKSKGKIIEFENLHFNCWKKVVKNITYFILKSKVKNINESIARSD